MTEASTMKKFDAGQYMRQHVGEAAEQ